MILQREKIQNTLGRERKDDEKGLERAQKLRGPIALAKDPG